MSKKRDEKEKNKQNEQGSEDVNFSNQQESGNTNLEEHELADIKDKDTEKAMQDECEVMKDSFESKYLELSDKFMRLAAEYDNFRRRSQKEKDGIYTECISNVTTSWLPVIDNLERAIFVSDNYDSTEAKKIAEGVEMILSQAREVLKGLGVEEIDANGNTFDPNKMEAVMHVEDESAGESQVVEVFTKGYVRGDKVIRHAIVKIAN